MPRALTVQPVRIQNQLFLDKGEIPPAKRHPTAFLLYYACIDGPHLVPEGLVFLLSAGLPMRGPAHPFQPYCGT